MTAEQRANIGRGVRIAAMRKRKSEAMKASWERRRSNGATEEAKIDEAIQNTWPKPDESSGLAECNKCHKIFKSEVGLRMHRLRKHSGKGWDTSGNLRPKQRKAVPELSVTFCPRCGCNIRNVETAIRFGESQ